jgi:hypothetical protein
MSVAFTREESAETAAEVELPDRPVSLHPNLVTESGLEVLANALAESHAAYNVVQQVEDAGERRRALAVASRETRYFADRLRSAQVVPPPVEFGTIVFGHKVTFKRDGRRQACPSCRGRRSGSSKWINFVRLPHRAGSDR